MPRRILAITLLIAFGFPLVASALAATADPEAALPACCRSHGAHHCAMKHSTLLAPSRNPAFVPPPCPFYPATTFAPRLTAALVAPAIGSAAHLRNPAPPAAAPNRTARIFLSSANLKRGPPAIA